MWNYNSDKLSGDGDDTVCVQVSVVKFDQEKVKKKTWGKTKLNFIDPFGGFTFQQQQQNKTQSKNTARIQSEHKETFQTYTTVRHWQWI